MPETASPRSSRWKRFLRFSWKASIVYVLLSLLLSFIPEGTLTLKVLSRERASFAGELRAGAGKAVITPPREMWAKMNLYDEKNPIAGVADDIHARALVLGAAGDNHVIAWVSIELLIVPPPMRPAVQAELTKRGLANVSLTLCATHTHAGPGNFWDAPFGRYYMGTYRPEYFEFVVARVADAVEQGMKSMRPARIGFAKVQTQRLVQERRWTEPQTGLPPPIDEELQVARVDGLDGSTIASVVSIGAHPTTLLHQTKDTLSGEFPGALSRILEEERKGSVALFVQGGEGSVRSDAPHSAENLHPYKGYRGIENEKFAKVAVQADMLHGYVTQAEHGLALDGRIDLAWTSVRAKLPGADVHFFPEERPWLAARVLTIIPNWLFNRVADWFFVPGDTTFQAMRINHAYAFTFPCDFSNAQAAQLKQLVRRDSVMPLALSNDYSMGYVLTREEYDMGGVHSLGFTERIQDYFGKRAGPFCMLVAHQLAQDIKEPGADDPFFFRFGDHPGLMPDGRPPVAPSKP